MISRSWDPTISSLRLELRSAPRQRVRAVIAAAFARAARCARFHHKPIRPKGRRRAAADGALGERFQAVARPQAPDFEQRQSAIVDQAAKLFATRGFLGTSIADLAIACGASKSLIYHYYPAKEEILYAVMASHIELLVEDVRQVMGSAGEASDLLRALVHRFMEHYVGAAPRQKVLLNELANLPAVRRAAIVEKQRVIVGAVEDLLTRLDSRLKEDKGRARVKAMLVLGMMNWTHIWFDPHGAVSADAVADMIADLAICSEEPES